MAEPNHTNHTRQEEFRVSGEDLIKKVRELIAKGNVRRLIIKNKDGKTLIEAPLTVGAAGVTALALFAPVLAAIGAIAALVTECSVIVESDVPADPNPEPKPAPSDPAPSDADKPAV